MKNKWLKKTMLFLALSRLTFSVTGCKAEHLFDKVLEKTDSKRVRKRNQRKFRKQNPRLRWQSQSLLQI